jgi:hypothetical protein
LILYIHGSVDLLCVQARPGVNIAKPASMTHEEMEAMLATPPPSPAPREEPSSAPWAFEHPSRKPVDPSVVAAAVAGMEFTQAQTLDPHAENRIKRI